MTVQRRRVLAALFVLAMLPASWPAAGQSVWYAVRGADHAFIVDMPGEPVYKAINAVSRAGGRYTNHSYSLETARLSFVAQSALPSPDIALGDPRRALQAILDERAARLAGGKWSRIDWRQVQGSAAVESIGAVDGAHVLRQLVVVHGPRVVSLACLGAADAVHGADAERFFASLRFPS